MKVLYLPLESPGAEDRGTARAMQKIFGAGYHGFDFCREQWQNHRSNEWINDEFVRIVREVEPDWVHGQYQDTGIIQASTISALMTAHPRTLFSAWVGDMREKITAYDASIARTVDVMTVSSVGKISDWRQAGAKNVWYWQIAVDPGIDCDLDAPPREYPFRVPEVVFCGNYYPQAFPKGAAQRMEMADALHNAGFDFGIVGSGWPRYSIGTCGVKEQRDVYRRAKVAVGCNNFNEIELYYSDRQLCAMASGTVHVCRYVPGLEREFIDGTHCVFWRTPEELVSKVRWLLGSEQDRRRIGVLGRQGIVSYHIWEHRVLQILPDINAELWKIRARGSL